MDLKHATVFGLALTLTALSAWANTSQNMSPDQVRAAFQACASQLGISAPQPGQKPSQLTSSQQSALVSCLESKGVTPPKGPPPGPDSSQQQQR